MWPPDSPPSAMTAAAPQRSIRRAILTDGTTGTAAAERGIDLRKALREHAAYEALEPLGDTVLTGNTGTNLCDFNVLYIGTQE